MIQNIEIEQNVLGTLLLDNNAYHEVSGLLSQEDFNDPVHQMLFAAMLKRFQSDQLVSPGTMLHEFEGHEGLAELGGPKYLLNLASANVSAFAIVKYVESLNKVTARRKLAGLLDDALADIQNDEKSPDEIVGQIEASLIDNSDNKMEIVSMLAATVKAAELAAATHQSDGAVGIMTGIRSLDAILGGLRGGDLILLGGRPAMGKSAVALSVAMSVARDGVGVVDASLEMTPEAIAVRAISNETAIRNKGVVYQEVLRGSLSEGSARAFFETAPIVGQLPIEILPPHMRTIGAIYAGVRKAARKLEAKGTPMGLIVVDYLQLIGGSGRTRFDTIGEISVALKGMAMKIGVPILALSQLSRACESRDNKRPMLSDLRESGNLEQDADVVMFCYRDEYYLERERPNRADEAEIMEYETATAACRGDLEIIVSKQRMGQIGTANVKINLGTNYIWETEPTTGF